MLWYILQFIQICLLQVASKPLHPNKPSKFTFFFRSLCGENAVICMASLWANWYHRGRNLAVTWQTKRRETKGFGSGLTASTGTCFYVGIQCEEFGRLASSHGGPLWQYLQVFGMLLVGTVELLEDHGAWDEHDRL